MPEHRQSCIMHSMSDLPTTDKWLSVEDAARAYAVSTRTIRRRLAMDDHGGLLARQIITRAGPVWRIAPPPKEEKNTPTRIDDQAMIPVEDAERFLATNVQELATTRAEIAQLHATYQTKIEQIEKERRADIERLQEARRTDTMRAEEARRADIQRVEDARRQAAEEAASEIGRLRGLLQAAELRAQQLEKQTQPKPLRWPDEPITINEPIERRSGTGGNVRV